MGTSEAALNGPSSTSLAGIGLEGRAGAGPCWDKVQQNPGPIWKGNERQEHATQLTQRRGTCTEPPTAPPSQSQTDLLVQKLNGREVRHSLVTLSQSVFLSEGAGKMLAVEVISLHKHQSPQ